VTDSWDRDDGTRPLSGRSIYTIPVCSLRLPGSGAAVRYLQNTIVLGSSPDADVFLDDDTVSRRHAEIVRQGDDYLLRDLDSTNGTHLSGLRIKEAYLAPGGEIGVGRVVLEFAPDSEVVSVVPSARDRLGDLVGQSPAMRRLFDLIRQVAPTDATILIEGETGTGKEVAARTLHEFSTRAGRPFVVIDCSAMPATLMESELFGHEKGSFSGAFAGRKGLFEMAHTGTVFLDEVGELSPVLQPKLLRVLETGEVRRVGANRALRFDVRVIAATNRNLAVEVNEGRFRQDLLYRLNVVPVRLPPLRERREDIEPLANHILQRAGFNRDGDDGLRLEQVPRAFLERLRSHDFPGNVRELVNILHRAVSLAPDGRIPTTLEIEGAAASKQASRSPAHSGGGAFGGLPGFKEAKQSWVAEFEEEYLSRLWQDSGGNISAAARRSGLDRKHLRQLLRKYGLV